MIKVSANDPLHHYQWGDGCDGWNFVDNASLSVKQERMPPGTSETLHYHVHAQQFFFILKGIAHFEVDGEVMTVNENEGLHIAAGKKHRISNKSGSAIEFILSSQPSTAGDRINIPS
ncbi:cupin domain-containing protein [Sediminibacterium roseum]|uniref:Cupin domain-containing protein n=1 Tax=Sediminibacterium roseum TaxID=1978412 RepID=A0ABW9ZNB9_9BACT|nr:cupin domain-containing protein [Sediminibacterium roseum]NCI48569.1 cupin domain-containing protein [Sediminibacterium roseum]